MTHISETFTIHPLEVGQMENFVYIIHDHSTNQATIVDPGWDVHKLLRFCENHQLQITQVLLTHSHYDHVNNLDELLAHCDAQVHLSEAEANFWGKRSKHFCLHQDNDMISLGETQIKLWHTPGHTPGSVCYHLGDYLLTGDTLFVRGCGRCDLAGGDAEQMFYSLQRLRNTCSPEMIIYPGHNYGVTPFSTMADQIA
ncbi:MAG: MBL fold metallo-hydrolase [Thiotrichaceae bacterium]